MLTLCSPTRRASKALPAGQELVAARRDSAVFASEEHVQEIAQPQPEVIDDIFSPLSSTFSLPPPPLSLPSPTLRLLPLLTRQNTILIMRSVFSSQNGALPLLVLFERDTNARERLLLNFSITSL